MIEPTGSDAPRQVERFYRVLIEAAPDAMLVIEAGAPHYLLVNAAAQQLLGYHRDELLQMGSVDILDPAEHSRLPAVRRAFEATGAWRGEWRLRRKDGSIVAVEATNTRHEIGGQVLYQGLFRDLTEHKRAQEALARREAQLAEAQRLTHIGSWEWDIPAARVWMSDEQYRIVGLEPQASPLALEAALACIHPEDSGPARAIMESSIRTGEPYETEFRVVRPDGEVRIVHSFATVLRDARGRPARIIGTAQDVTERRQVEAELRDSQRAAARLEGVTLAAREMAHLLNNALSMPVAAIELLTEHGTVPAHLRPLVDQAATSLMDAKQYIIEFQQVVRVEIKDTIVGPSLDLARSVQLDGPHTDAGGAARAESEELRP